MSETVLHTINKLRQRYLFYRMVEIGLISVGISFVFFAISSAFINHKSFTIAISLVITFISFALLAWQYKLTRTNASDLTRFLNQQYPILQQSADLLIKSDSQLTRLEKIQRIIVQTRFEELYPNIKLPNKLIQSVALFVGLMAFSFILNAYLPQIKIAQKAYIAENTEKTPIINATTSVSSFAIHITPPAYTNIQPSTSKNFDIVILERSVVRWTLQFSGDVISPKLIFSNSDSVTFTSDKGVYSLRKEFFQSGFYQLKWSEKGKKILSDFYRIEVIRDESPKIAVTNLNQFTKLKYSDSPLVQVSSQITDDYALSKADIIATVSKGSGEGVKFREEKLTFSSPSVIGGKLVNASTLIDLMKLGLEPGDELYFYIEAFDNKTPRPNRSRTETFFIALQDTTKNLIMDDEGLGVDLMPDYFRSQRQIIIDTEKLLKEKPTLSKQRFNSTSNELGFDQKTLRLKYGQFLGEEEDSGIATDFNPDMEEEEAEDPMKKFGHQHDNGNEHNLVQEKKPEHEHEEPNTDKEKDPLAAFVHSHDNSEVATFFEQSLRAKLKAALTVMWDAELHLRLYQPEKSLPYQYTALKLLKEISNDSRIYVHRTGFEPPPLKEEKRLTADLSDVKGSVSMSKPSGKTDWPNIREALLLTEHLLQSQVNQLSSDQLQVFQNAGVEFSAIALEQPALLEGLSLLKKIIDNRSDLIKRERDLQKLRIVLWRALPEKISGPSQQTSTLTKLDQLFIQQLESKQHE